MHANTRRAVGRALTRARDMMNDNGAHWIKHSIRGYKKGEIAYCSLGAIIHSTPDGTPVDNYGGKVIRQLAKISLARVIDPDRMAAEESKLNDIFKGPHNEDMIRRNLARTAGEVITTWNDHPDRRWRDVDRKFRKAVKSLHVA